MFEVEEWVGGLWHRAVTRYADDRYAEAAVTLTQMRKEVGVLYRALGGERAVRIDTAAERPVTLPRTLWQRVAGSHRRLALPYLNEEVLALPGEVALFPAPELNREVYRMLAATAALSPSVAGGLDWAQAACHRYVALCAAYPAMRSRYDALIKAYLPLRIPLQRLPSELQDRETRLRNALQHLEFAAMQASDMDGLQPPPFWLYPAQGEGTGPVRREAPAHETPPEDKPPAAAETDAGKKAQGEYVEDHDGDKGLLVFRLENLFSWSEYLKLDRTADDSPDEDAARIAEDLDHLSLSTQEFGGGQRIKLNLDLPSASEDDTPLGPGLYLPEWDYRCRRLLPDHCLLQPLLDHRAPPCAPPPQLRRAVKAVRARFEQMRPMRFWRRNQAEGEEIEMERWNEFCADRIAGGAFEQPMFKSFSGRLRDLDCLLLADLSMSTDAYVDNDRRVIDVISDALLLFSEALDAVGDRFALYGFSSCKRQHVRFHVIKNFAEPYTNAVRGRIVALRPGFYTRIGAAIRQSTTILRDQKASRRLLLILTDGKPNDLDLYEGRYGLEDTRQAVLEARRAGLIPFCITVDKEAGDYLPYLFGDKGYVLVNSIQRLPRELPKLYATLMESK
ncbi:Nitric oxide reductase activation protein [Hahella chejuensis KCTC 2396]|uniref:Nitric oxide reductase activation protein n=1 Tax=Hahella chejuensis (strain KCTC 2396) TaxID=349521 RepID=Q2SE11_HAHCH|nr:VWA domain-containing protein [Hahella chejuensis]ABC31113.1 Nitric oxide reductase activation protein [Hahella chejuensis KCTC 2396]